MTEHTRNIVIAVLNGDSTITPETVKSALAVLEGAKVPDMIAQDRVLKRKEAAQLMGRTTRTVDLLCQSGILRRVTIGTRRRAFGILASSLVEAMRCDAGRSGISGKAVTA